MLDSATVERIGGVILQHGPWAALSWYVIYKHFKLHERTIEVMTGLKTLIENLECRGGNHGRSRDVKRNRGDNKNESTQEV